MVDDKILQVLNGFRTGTTLYSTDVPFVGFHSSSIININFYAYFLYGYSNFNILFTTHGY